MYLINELFKRKSGKMTQKLTWLEIFLLYSYIFHVHFPQTEPKQEQKNHSISIENDEI